MRTRTSSAAASAQITIKAPNFKILPITIVGNAPFVSNAFPQEAKEQMKADQEAGSTARTGKKKRDPKDFEAGYQGSLHRPTGGDWFGIPATAIKAALVRACSVAGIEMTKAKMCLFVLADGYDDEGTPLVKITKGTPKRFDSYVRNANGSPDIRARAKFDPGWEAKVQIKFDADMFTAEHVANLVNRAGISVGVGAGRPFSTNSTGMGWGTFEIKQEA